MSLGSEENTQLPFCECRHFRKTHLPCKHFTAIFNHISDVSWNHLQAFYMDHPLITVDQDCVGISSLVDCPVPEEVCTIAKQCNLNKTILLYYIEKHKENLTTNTKYTLKRLIAFIT